MDSKDLCGIPYFNKHVQYKHTKKEVFKNPQSLEKKNITSNNGGTVFFLTLQCISVGNVFVNLYFL
jgi:hypothetical protein